LFSLWGILASLKQFSNTHNIRQGQVTIACNGQSALKKAKQDYPTQPSKSHYDLINAIRNLQWAIPIKLRFEHVKGHQDQGVITALPRLAWMNIEMHLRAKHTLLSTELNDIQDKIPFEGWTCLIEGWHVVKHLTAALHRHLKGKTLLNYWRTKERISQQVEQTIDLESAEKAMNKLPLAKRQWVSKVATKFLPDGKNMQCWGLRTQAKCPRCPCPVNDKDHIFKCKEE